MTRNPNTVYPTLNTKEEAYAKAMSLLPITNPIHLFAVLNTYHNTLANQVKKDSHGDK